MAVSSLYLHYMLDLMKVKGRVQVRLPGTGYIIGCDAFPKGIPSAMYRSLTEETAKDCNMGIGFERTKEGYWADHDPPQRKENRELG